MNPQSAQDLINIGFYGYQGWDNASALADFRATGGAGKGSNTSGASNSTSSGGAQTNSSTSSYSNGQAANDIKSQYSNLLGVLKGQSDTQTAAEYGARGIPTSSGIVGQAQTQNYANSAAQLLTQESRDLAGLSSDPLSQLLKAASGGGANGGSGATASGVPNWEAEHQAQQAQNPNNNNQTQSTTSNNQTQVPYPNYTGQRLSDGSPAILGLPGINAASYSQPSYVNGVNNNPSSSQLSNLRAQPNVSNTGTPNALSQFTNSGIFPNLFQLLAKNAINSQGPLNNFSF